MPYMAGKVVYMKKYLIVGIVFMILLSCVGCTKKNQKIIDFKPDEILNIEVYDIHESSSKLKIVTDEKDIKAIIGTLSAVKIKGDEALSEPTAGGALKFVFNKSDNSQFVVLYNGSTLLSPDNFSYEVDSKSNIFDLWGQMRYDTHDRLEYERSVFTEWEVPYLELQFVTHGDVYHIDASLGVFNWRSGNADGTGKGIHNDTLHPLDCADEIRKIDKKDDMNKVEMKFSLPPDSYTVQRWQDKYIGDANANDQYYETVNISDNSITLSDDEKGYVYEVRAIWAQGNVYYCFYIVN